MFQADRRPHQAGTSAEANFVTSHRLVAQKGLADAHLGSLATLDRNGRGGRQCPAKARLPDEIDVAELRGQPPVAVRAAAQGAEALVDPAFFAIDGNQPHIAMGI